MHKIMRLPEVKNCTGLSRSTIYKKMAEKCFPKNIPLGSNSVGWLEADIQNWIQDRVSKTLIEIRAIEQYRAENANR